MRSTVSSLMLKQHLACHGICNLLGRQDQHLKIKNHNYDTFIFFFYFPEKEISRYGLASPIKG